MGKFSNSSGAVFESTCVNCPQGKFSEKVGVVVCQKCPMGKYSNGDGQISDSTCKDCGRGKYLDEEGKTSCLDCEAGKYQTDQGNTICLDCEAGKYQTEHGAEECFECAAGKYSEILAARDPSTCLNCTQNSVSPSGSSLPTHCECNIGYTGPNGGLCEACVPGTFKPSIGSLKCTECGVGKYNMARAARSEDYCTSCPSSSVSASGSIDVSACYCNQGFSNKDSGIDLQVRRETVNATGAQNWTDPLNIGSDNTVVCLACLPGKYKTEVGFSLCSTCSEGTYSVEIGATSEAACTTCPSFSWSLRSSPKLASCFCLSGHTVANGGECDACLPGKFKAANGSLPCTLCDLGKYSDHDAKTECTVCPSNSFTLWQGITVVMDNVRYVQRERGVRTAHSALTARRTHHH